METINYYYKLKQNPNLYKWSVDQDFMELIDQILFQFPSEHISLIRKAEAAEIRKQMHFAIAVINYLAKFH